MPNEHRCPMCGRQALDGITHPRCKTAYGLDGLTSFFHYDGVIRKAIKALKYRYRTDLAEEFVSLTPQTQYSGILVPIPLHVSRYKERGFNQSEILGKFFAQKQKLRMAKDMLVRTKKTLPQAEIAHRKDRLKNMEGVFGLNNSVQESIILFDDVFTTGATMRSAAKVLKQKGARPIWAITMAR